MTTTLTTITAEELQAGDEIIGDRMYPNGTLHLTVQSARSTINGLTIRVKALSGPYDIPRLIAYGATETVTVRRAAGLAGKIVALENSRTGRTRYVKIDSGIVDEGETGAAFDYTAPLTSRTFTGVKVRRTRTGEWLVGSTFTTISASVLGYKTTIRVAN